ncbi:hypothetical protein [Cronobacter sakazakii]|uniref:hypothetical protein n=1 Tax=Cronobacter sakazakii TaxID=28141 RepID=UPI000A11ADF8|nr:hypothetical protein [Cronobacter sakazakii]
MKGSSSRIKNKAGAQKGAFIKMKQENIYIYQREYALCYVPIIAPLNQALNIWSFLFISTMRHIWDISFLIALINYMSVPVPVPAPA